MDLEADMLDTPTQNDTPKSQHQKKKKKKVEGKVSGEDNDNDHHHGIPPDQIISNQIELIHFNKELNPSKARQIKKKT